MRKLNHRKVKLLVQSHTVAELGFEPLTGGFLVMSTVLCTWCPQTPFSHMTHFPSTPCDVVLR